MVSLVCLWWGEDKYADSVGIVKIEFYFFSAGH